MLDFLHHHFVEAHNDDDDDDDGDDDDDDAEELDFNYIYENWVTQYTGDTNYNIVDNTKVAGDCFFTVITDAFKSIDKVFSVKSLRELLSREATQELFENYKELYTSYKKSIKNDTRELKQLKKQNDELNKKIKDKKLTKKQRKEIIIEAKQNKENFERTKDERKTTEDLLNEYRFMKNVDSLCDFKKAIKRCDFWAETWAISTLERLLNTKVIILSSESYKAGDIDNVLQCGQLNDTALQEQGVFNPDFYIIADYTGDHYKLITHKDNHIFTFTNLPSFIKDRIIEKCLEGEDGVGTFALIPEFKEFKR